MAISTKGSSMDFTNNPREQRHLEAEKIVDLHSMDGSPRRPASLPSLRARRVPENVRRKKYRNAVGRMYVDDDDDDESYRRPSTNRLGHSISHHDRMKIRRRIKQKSQKIPGHVKWVKWMNSDSKNRK